MVSNILVSTVLIVIYGGSSSIDEPIKTVYFFQTKSFSSFKIILSIQFGKKWKKINYITKQRIKILNIEYEQSGLLKSNDTFIVIYSKFDKLQTISAICVSDNV